MKYYRLKCLGFPVSAKTEPVNSLKKHADQLQTYYAAALDSKRGQAVNPTSNSLYFDMIEKLVATGDDNGPLDL